MDNKGNFWFWTGLVSLLIWGIVVLLNISKFSQVPPDSNFLIGIFIFSFLIGFIVFICASLSKNSN